MAKHPCPNCRKWFDYEFNSWVCPNCGTVITGSMESEVLDTGDFQARPQKKYKAAPTVRDYDRKHGTGAFRFRGKVIKIAAVLITLGLVAGAAFAVHKDVKKTRMEPETIPSAEVTTTEVFASTEAEETKPSSEAAAEETEPASEAKPEITEIQELQAEIGEAIPMHGYDLTVTEIFEPQWQELPKAEGWKYIAVSFEKNDANGNEMYGFTGKDAYASLYDKTEGVPLMSLYESDIISYEDEQTSLYMSYNMISGLSYGSGTILFLVKDTSLEFELCIYEGEGTSYSDYELHAERRIVIPVTRNVQEVSLQS